MEFRRAPASATLQERAWGSMDRLGFGIVDITMYVVPGALLLLVGIMPLVGVLSAVGNPLLDGISAGVGAIAVLVAILVSYAAGHYIAVIHTDVKRFWWQTRRVDFRLPLVAWATLVWGTGVLGAAVTASEVALGAIMVQTIALTFYLRSMYAKYLHYALAAEYLAIAGSSRRTHSRAAVFEARDTDERSAPDDDLP